MPSTSSIIHHPSSIPSPWLHRYAMLLVLATLVLVALGGNVTSRGAGLAVPDGFTVYGYFLWLFPYEKWVGNIFHEHIHRLKGSLVGLMCIGLALWIWIERRRAISRGDAGMAPRVRPWLPRLGFAVLALVIIQGVMGGFRVSQISTSLAVVHGILGQLFFCLVVFTAAAIGPTWGRIADKVRALPNRQAVADGARTMRRVAVTLVVITLFQLAFGAAMRHTDAGLAIPDFPTSYGRVLPPWTQKQIDAASSTYYADTDYSSLPAPVGAGQVHVHFTHRVWALAVVIAALVAVFRIGPLLGSVSLIRNPLLAILGLLTVQVVLGVSVIWTGRHPDVATAHQVIGAITLAMTVLLATRVFVATSAALESESVPGTMMPAATQFSPQTAHLIGTVQA